MKERKPRCNPEDIIGKVIEKDGTSLTVIGIHGRRATAHNQFEYDCRCSCGKEVVLTRNSLMKKNGPHGCRACINYVLFCKKRVEKNFEKIIGRRYGYLTVKEITERGKSISYSKFLCACDCGGEVEIAYKKLSTWKGVGMPHCRECKATKHGLYKLDGTPVFDDMPTKQDDLKNYSDKDPFITRRKCLAECNVCMLRKLVCCHDCTMYSDYTKCYKHCHENPETCGKCRGARSD